MGFISVPFLADPNTGWIKSAVTITIGAIMDHIKEQIIDRITTTDVIMSVMSVSMAIINYSK